MTETGKGRRSIRICYALFLALLIGAAELAVAQRELGFSPTSSGGPLSDEQASYDVTFYDLKLKVDPADSSIAGKLAVRARIVRPIEWFVLDLDTLLRVTSVVELHGSTEVVPMRFEHRDGRLRIALPGMRLTGDSLAIEVVYGGRPRIALRPPWIGGFTWSTTEDGEPWIGVSCQSDGADVWWPCKDHPSDEPDSMALYITVPKPLVCAANGRLRGITDNDDGTHTYHWFVSNPINNYSVSLNIAPYRTIEDTYTSVTGEAIPVTYWVLPESYEQGLALFPQFSEHLRFLETYLGPYPFRADKYGVAETPYLGMEHQTIIAYGNQYRDNDYGFDVLHLHELAHEWFGNLVTCADWKDMWLHEGFAVYLEALYAEHLHGDSALQSYMTWIRPRLRNLKPVAPRESQRTVEIYFMPPDYTRSDGDMYYKGAYILHSLRYLIGDESFFRALRRMAYPNPALETVTDGSQSRFVGSDDFQKIAEDVSGRDLDWFFDLYLRQEELPELVANIRRGRLNLRWKAPWWRPFPMPVPVQIGEEIQQVAIPRRQAAIAIPEGIQPIIDPEHRLLKVGPH